MSTPPGVRLDPFELRRLRRVERLTQRELAERVGLSAVHYRNLESDRARASLDVLASLAGMLGVAPLTITADVDKDRVRL